MFKHENMKRTGNKKPTTLAIVQGDASHKKRNIKFDLSAKIPNSKNIHVAMSNQIPL